MCNPIPIYGHRKTTGIFRVEIFIFRAHTAPDKLFFSFAIRVSESKEKLWSHSEYFMRVRLQASLVHQKSAALHYTGGKSICSPSARDKIRCFLRDLEKCLSYSYLENLTRIAIQAGTSNTDANQIGSLKLQRDSCVGCAPAVRPAMFGPCNREKSIWRM